MTITEEMSVPQWKLALMQKQQRKRDEQERKAREEEEKRRAKLPAWKRHAEQPKTVIIIDKNKVANPVNLSKSSTSSGASATNGNNNAPVPNGSVPSSSLAERELFGIEKQGKTGDDETDSEAPGGVSEEHCTSVHDNPFLKLEQKKRKAPPPPKGGSNISVIATNVPASTTTGTKTNSSKTVSVTSNTVKTNHIQQNGPRPVAESQIKSSTKSAEKNNSRTDVQKTKSATTVPKSGDSGNSTTSTSPATAGAQLSTKVIRKTGDDSSSEPARGPESPTKSKRKASIVELRSLFGAPVSPTKTNNNNNKVQSKQHLQPVQSNAKIISKNSGLSDSKSASQAKPKEAQTVAAASTIAKSSNSSSTSKDVSSASKNTSSVKSEESKKNDVNAAKTSSVKSVESKKNDINAGSKTKNEGKSLSNAQQEKASLKKRPSEADMSASAIIDLQNEGPLKQREGQFKRASAIYDEDKEISLDSQESPRSAANARLKKYEESSKQKESEKETKSAASKRRAPIAPLGDAKKAEEPSENSKAAKKDDETKSEIDYPKNFRNPDVTAPKEEMPYPKDFRKAATSASQDKTSSQSSAKKSGEVSSGAKEESKKKNGDSSSTSKLSNSSKTSNGSIERTASETKESKAKADSSSSQNDIPYPSDFRKPVSNSKGTTKGKDTSSNQGEIPYPSDFRKPAGQASTESSSAGQKDIIKPSDLAASASSKDSKKGDGGNGSGPATFLGFKLRKTKKPETAGITVISSNDNNKKPTVENTSNKSTSSLIAVGTGGSHMAAGTGKKKATVKKYEKVEMEGYNTPTDKPSALKSVGKSPKRNVKFSKRDSQLEEIFEYLSEEAFIAQHEEGLDDPEEDAKGGKKKTIPVSNGMKNGYMDSDEEEVDGGMKSNTALKTSGGFQNMAANNRSAMDMLLGRGPREEPKPTPKPEPTPEPEQTESELKPDEGDIFSSAGQGTAALLF